MGIKDNTQRKNYLEKLDDKIGYVDFGRLQVSQIDRMFTDLKNTDIIILDDRSYPQGTVWTMINYSTNQFVTACPILRFPNHSGH